MTRWTGSSTASARWHRRRDRRAAQRLDVGGRTRNLVATRAKVAPTRTVGRAGIEALIVWGMLGRGPAGDADVDPALGCKGLLARIRRRTAAHDCRSANISGCDKPGIGYGKTPKEAAGERSRRPLGLAEGRPEGVRAPGRQAVNAFPGADNSDAEPCELQEPCCAGRRDGPLKRVDEVGRKTGPAQHLRPRTGPQGLLESARRGRCPRAAAAPSARQVRPVGQSTRTAPVGGS